MIFRPSYYYGAVILTCCSLLNGCGGADHELETTEVTGVVTLDGRPVTTGKVIFSPMRGRPARGLLNANGEFSLYTYENGDGAILGTHRISVVVNQPIEEKKYFESTPPAGQNLVQRIVPRRYGNPATSELEFEVRSDQENFVKLELTSKAL